MDALNSVVLQGKSMTPDTRMNLVSILEAHLGIRINNTEEIKIKEVDSNGVFEGDHLVSFPCGTEYEVHPDGGVRQTKACQLCPKG